MLRSRRSLVVVSLAVMLAAAGWFFLRERSSSPPAGPSPSAASGSSAVAHERSPDSSPGPSAGAGAGSEGEGLADILEPEGAQMTEMLRHLQVSCPAASASRGLRPSISVVTRCVEDAEGVMNLVDLLGGTIEGPAGAAMPADVRARWRETLESAKGTVRRMLTPVWESVGQRLASGAGSPAEFRALGHLRDRIGRILSAAGRP
jgi:hypothetical protein